MTYNLQLRVGGGSYVLDKLDKDMQIQSSHHRLLQKSGVLVAAFLCLNLSQLHGQLPVGLMRCTGRAAQGGFNATSPSTVVSE